MPNAPSTSWARRPTIPKTTKFRTCRYLPLFHLPTDIVGNTQHGETLHSLMDAVKGDSEILRIFVTLVPACLHGGRGVGGGELVGAVKFGAVGGGDGPVEEGVFRLVHPGFQTRPHIFEHVFECGILGQVIRLVGVVEEVVELLGGDGALGPAVGEDYVLGRAVIYVGEYGGRVFVVEAPDVLPAMRAGAALRLVGDVVSLFREEGVADLLGLTVNERQERFALEP